MTSHSSIILPEIILASSSTYRQQLLRQLRLNFKAISPAIDEQRFPNEPPESMVLRLAQQKAEAIAVHHPQAVVIGSDQASVNDEEVLGKPHNFANAFQQLKAASGRKVTFFTGLYITQLATKRHYAKVVPYHVHFRDLSDKEITRYLEQEQPYDCAGAFKSEGLGISLFDNLEGSDPNALIGLPLIEVCRALRKWNIAIP